MSAELEAEVAALRLMLREVAQTDATGIDYALRCQRERDAAEAERDEARALKAPPTVDELNAALMNAAVAKIERDVAIARAEQAEAERDRLVALRAAEAEKVIRRDEHIAKVEAERDELGNEAVDRLMLISDLRAVVLATCERAQEVEVELAKANALLREAHAWVWAVSDRDADTVKGLRARIEAHLEGR